MTPIRLRCGLVVSRLGNTAEKGGHAEKFKGAGRDQAAIEALGAFTRAIEDVKTSIGDYAVKDVVLLDVVEKFGACENRATAGFVSFRVVDLDRDNTTG